MKTISFEGPDWLLDYLNGAIQAGKTEAANIEKALRIKEGKSDFAERMQQIEEALKSLKLSTSAKSSNPPP